MKVADAAYEVLHSKRGHALTCRGNVALATDQGLSKTTNSNPWTHLHAALNLQVANDVSLERNPRFELVSDKWKLNNSLVALKSILFYSDRLRGDIDDLS